MKNTGTPKCVGHFLNLTGLLHLNAYSTVSALYSILSYSFFFDVLRKGTQRILFLTTFINFFSHLSSFVHQISYFFTMWQLSH